MKGNGNGTRDPDAIMASIERTRSEMDSTLTAIEERLSPGQFVDQGLNYLRNSGGREYLSNLGNSVKENPLPATLVAIGLGWLMVTGQRRGTGAYGSRYAYDDESTWRAEELRQRAGEAAAAAKDTMASAKESIATAKDNISGAVHSAREGMAATAYRAREGMASTAYRAREGIAATASRARTAWRATSDTTRQQIDRARTRYMYLLQEQPLALGALGIGLGALLAAAAPRSRFEDQMIGNTSDRLKEQVKEQVAETGREQFKRAQNAVSSKVESATQKTSDGPSRPAAQGSDQMPSGDGTPPAGT
jgi:hypothetical protein